MIDCDIFTVAFGAIWWEKVRYEVCVGKFCVSYYTSSLVIKIFSRLDFWVDDFQGSD